MIVVRTSVPVDPDQREEAIELFETLAERSRAEDGAVEYRAVTEIAAPNTVWFLEQYEDLAALGAHTRTDHYRELLVAKPDLLDSPVETVRFEVDEPPTSHRLAPEDLRELGP